MNYEPPFHGEYNHHPLFRVGSSLYLAGWSASEFQYWARPVVICSINISPEENITYNVQLAESAETIECQSCKLWETIEAAKECAYRKLQDELSMQYEALSAERRRAQDTLEEADRRCREFGQRRATLVLVRGDDEVPGNSY